MTRHALSGILVIFSVLSASYALTFPDEHQYRLGSDDFTGKHDLSRLKCNLASPIDPSEDGLLSSNELFSGSEALDTMVKRHQPLVRIESICYDDLGEFDDDERWKPFEEIPGVLKRTYPTV